MASDLDRKLLLEQARKTAEVTYASSPLDADNLTIWGGTLMELSQFQPNLQDTKQMLKDGVLKLEEAVLIDPRKHEAHWGIGNALTNLAFLNPDLVVAKGYFGRAEHSFQQAVDLDPGNELYRRSLEITASAPLLHMEVHNQGLGQPQNMDAGSSTSGFNSIPNKDLNKKNTDLTYDIFGWVILAAGIVAWIGFAKSLGPPPPPPPI